jgi:hypothetical protein
MPTNEDLLTPALDAATFWSRQAEHLANILRDIAPDLPIADGVTVLRLVRDHERRVEVFLRAN